MIYGIQRTEDIIHNLELWYQHKSALIQNGRKMGQLNTIMLMVNNISNAIKKLSNLKIEYRTKQSKIAKDAVEKQQIIVPTMIDEVNEQIMLEKLYSWNP